MDFHRAGILLTVVVLRAVVLAHEISASSIKWHRSEMS